MSRPIKYTSEYLLDKMLDAFWECGYYNTSMERLCDETGVNRQVLYHRYDSKEGMYHASLDRYYDVNISNKTTSQLFDGLIKDRLGCFLVDAAQTTVEDRNLHIPKLIESLRQLFIKEFDEEIGNVVMHKYFGLSVMVRADLSPSIIEQIQRNYNEFW